MPVTRFKPVPANESSASDEESTLELYLQKQLEEDVARIFDESIYSDIEVVCGKLKVLTHTCILKARTNKFYHKLETILHVNIERHTFDEIYSFISDAYTECDIKKQEQEIIKYLKANFLFLNTDKTKTGYPKEEDADVFLTPKCVSPYAESKILKLNGTSPNTELTREYYALVPIEGNLLEQELSEQDALSNAFHSIIKTQNKDTGNFVQHVKPTTLSLTSSHSSKTVKHSISCDIISNYRIENTSIVDSNLSKENSCIPNKHEIKSNQQLGSKNINERVLKKPFISDCKIDRALDSACSPDSLITDDPSSSSDYLSAAFNYSPGLGSTDFFSQLNVGENFTKMENIFTSSDSGLENTGMLESLSSHKDVTLTDFSLTESALHESVTDDQNPSIDCSSNSYAESDQCLRFRQFDTNADTSLRSLTKAPKEGEGNGQNDKQLKQRDVGRSKSSKEEKQRQNEEIVILESSSVSSETGSWESIFPPKGSDKEICAKFLNNERQLIVEHEVCPQQEKLYPPPSSLTEKIEYKPTSCFIDASSLVDEEEPIKIQVRNDVGRTKADSKKIPTQPLPCSTTHKLDISPSDWSESNENDDSLEQADNKGNDSIQKDLSPTIFEMTPITEDSLCANTFESAATNRSDEKLVEPPRSTDLATDKESLSYASTVYVATTPHNSILSVNISSVKEYGIEEISNDNIAMCAKDHGNVKKSRCDESSPIVSGGSSLISRTPQYEIHRNNLEASNDLLSHDNIVSITSSWVVDMSSTQKPEVEDNTKNYQTKKPSDKVCDGLKNEIKDRQDSNHKSRGSVDSDSSEKSSHKFYIDLSSLPDPLPPKKTTESETSNEKKNIFSMYIDLGDKGPVKEMPVRLSSSLNVKKQTDNKVSPKTGKTNKITNPKNTISTAKIIECESVFEEIESLCNDPNISITDIIGIPDKSRSSKINEATVEKELLKEKKHSRSINGENKLKQNTIPVIHEEIIHKSSGDLFVKLSDLDKPVQKSEISVHDIHNEKGSIDVRMTRSIPDNNWGEQNSSMACRSIEVLSSFHSENALSLNRLFPHLKNEFSKSMPGSLSARTRSPFRPSTITSPGEVEDQVSDVSELSSVQSSMCRSVVENSTTEETSQTSSLIGNCQSRLGQDLLRMFLEEIAPDVIVEVSGKRIKAHKCILSSRCQYFAGILSGGWVESAGNVIVLPPFSFNVVHFALCHIYSGLASIPDSISIVELATIADMLGLEGLKEAIMFTLKAKYCHHFHRPCPVCTAGVLECFPLSSVYGLDDLYRKCLRWITKYFSKVWPTKAFATLPKELLDKCYQEHIVNLSTENLIETVYGCGITVASLPNSRWAETVARMCRRLVNAEAQFAALRLVCVLEMIATVSNDAPTSAKEALDDCLTAAIEWAPPDETCRAYAFLSNLVREIRNHQYSKPDLISTGNKQMKVTDSNNLLYTHAGSWRLQCEETLVRAAPRVVGTQAFKDLPSDLRKRLRELGCIMYGPQAIPITSSPLQVRKSKSVYQSKSTKTHNYTSATRSLDMEKVRQSFVPYKAKPIAIVGTEKIKSNSELRDKRATKSVPPKVRTTKAQEERAKFNQTKTHVSQDRLNSKPRPHPFENTKPRYLEPRQCKDDTKKVTPKKLMNKIVSSSESSRNSSPVLARNLRSSCVKAKAPQAQTMSQDSLATSSRPRTAEPSTDSLSESQTSNKYATYTKAKHTCRGSVESVRSPKCAVPSMHNSNNKTKIPVYLNQNSVPNNYEFKEPEINKRSPLAISNQNSESKASPASPKPKSKSYVRSVPGSLMNATKASSAKMVTKIVKDIPSAHKVKQKISATKASRQNEPDRPREIPVMGRSGTFLKDEPTFGDKTTNIDIGQ